MKQNAQEASLYESTRPRNQISQKKKLIEFIKKQEDKKLQLHGNKRKKQLIGYSNGEWTLRELKLYHRYLSTHKNQFTDPHLRKKNKVFIKLADFIGSRTPDQCRSHHQKATCKFPDFDQLLDNYQSKILKLSKLYQEMSNPKSKKGDYQQEKRIKVQQLSFQKQFLVIQEQQEYAKQQNQLFIKAKEQIQIQQEKAHIQKKDHATRQIITNNYYNLDLTRWENAIRIEIQKGLMQILE